MYNKYVVFLKPHGYFEVEIEIQSNVGRDQILDDIIQKGIIKEHPDGSTEWYPADRIKSIYFNHV